MTTIWPISDGEDVMIPNVNMFDWVVPRRFFFISCMPPLINLESLNMFSKKWEGREKHKEKENIMCFDAPLSRIVRHTYVFLG